jgi:hypothetical protein
VAGRDDEAMKSEPLPIALPPDATRLQALVDLRDRLHRLHAELEFLRLMLRMRSAL